MNVRHAAALAAVAGLVAGPLISVVSVGAGPVAVSTVAVFSHDDYTDPGDEDANLIDDLEAGGHTVVLIDELTAAAFTTGLDGAQVLAIPEIDSEDFLEDADEATLDVIDAFVDDGGRILFFGSNDPTPLINELFGFEVDQIDDFCDDEAEGVPDAVPSAVGDPCVLTAEAVDTELADGPATVSYVSDSTTLDPTTLPTGSTIFYEGQLDDESDEVEEVGSAAIIDVAAAVSMPFGDGAVLYLGWDWFPAGVADREPAWAQVLDLSVSQPEVTASSPAPGALDLTMDSPSTQPVFVRLVINGTEHIVTIAAKTTTASFDVGGAATVEWDVPGWGIGEGTVEVAGATAAPPAEPTPAAPDFTG